VKVSKPFKDSNRKSLKSLEKAYTTKKFFECGRPSAFFNLTQKIKLPKSEKNQNLFRTERIKPLLKFPKLSSKNQNLWGLGFC